MPFREGSLYRADGLSQKTTSFLHQGLENSYIMHAAYLGSFNDSKFFLFIILLMKNIWKLHLMHRITEKCLLDYALVSMSSLHDAFEAIINSDIGGHWAMIILKVLVMVQRSGTTSISGNLHTNFYYTEKHFLGGWILIMFPFKR